MLPEPGIRSLPFVFVCDPLNELDDLVNREDYLLPRHLTERRNRAVLQWFGSHCLALESCNKTSESVLALLQPKERRKDWIYGLNHESLERTIARALHLPIEYLPELQKWRDGAPRMDLGACVEETMSKHHNELRTCPPAIAHKTSVYDIEHALLRIACHHPRSSATIRSFAGHYMHGFDTKLKFGEPFRFDSASTLYILYGQLSGTQAKWLTRLLLKDFGPRKLFPDGLDLKASFRLPKCIKQFDLPNREGPGLLSFKSILQGVETPPTPEFVTSKLTVTSTPINQFKSIFPPPQVLDLLPTSPTTLKKDVNEYASRTKKLKVASSSSNANNRRWRAPVSQPPLRHQPSLPSLMHQKQDTSISQRPLINSRAQRKSTPISVPHIIDLTSSPISIVRQPHLPKRPDKCKQRTPLSSIDHNSQSQNSHVSVPSSFGLKVSARRKTPSKAKSSKSRMKFAGTGTCRLTHARCQLVNCIFLLSPCISDDPWVSDSLLAWHGSRFTKSTTNFVKLMDSSQHAQIEEGTRKIILVDTKRTSQTVEFLKRVQTQSNLSEGCKQWVEVHDWRLLEYMAKIDRGKQYTYDPWDRCRMCTI